MLALKELLFRSFNIYKDPSGFWSMLLYFFIVFTPSYMLASFLQKSSRKEKLEGCADDKERAKVISQLDQELSQMSFGIAFIITVIVLMQ